MDLAIKYFYYFKYDKIQRACNICLYEERKRAQRVCERIEDFLEGVQDYFSDCFLNVCDYDCLVGELEFSDVAGDDEYCGCETFQCPTFGGQSDANTYHNGLIMISLGIIFVIFG